jgi:hypothetical protein
VALNGESNEEGCNGRGIGHDDITLARELKGTSNLLGIGVGAKRY